MKVSFGIVEINEAQILWVNRALNSRRLSYGPITKQLEQRIADLHGVKHAIFMASGTCALQVLLKAAKEYHDWSDNSEIIIPATTFIATASAVLDAGLVPVLCDVDPVTFNMDINAFGPRHLRTVGVLPVHLLGRPANMTAIMAEANRIGLTVLEDCCEAVGVRYQGQPVGSFGLGGAISTYVCHHMSTGVGGAVLTNNDDIATICRSLMQHGRNPAYLKLEDDDNLDDSQVLGMMRARYEFVRWGHSYRATEMEAALGLGHMNLHGQAAHRRYVAGELNKIFGSWPSRVHTQTFDEESSPLFYPVVLKQEEDCLGLAEAFEKAGIETRPVMPLLNQPIVIKSLLQQHDVRRRFPNSWRLLNSAFLIGCHPGMWTVHLEYIRQVTDTYFRGKCYAN